MARRRMACLRRPGVATAATQACRLLHMRRAAQSAAAAAALRRWGSLPADRISSITSCDQEMGPHSSFEQSWTTGAAANSDPGHCHVSLRFATVPHMCAFLTSPVVRLRSSQLDDVSEIASSPGVCRSGSGTCGEQNGQVSSSAAGCCQQTECTFIAMQMADRHNCRQDTAPHCCACCKSSDGSKASRCLSLSTVGAAIQRRRRRQQHSDRASQRPAQERPRRERRQQSSGCPEAADQQPSRQLGGAGRRQQGSRKQPQLAPQPRQPGRTGGGGPAEGQAGQGCVQAAPGPDLCPGVQLLCRLCTVYHLTAIVLRWH